MATGKTAITSQKTKMKPQTETDAEQIERLRHILGDRICAGVIFDEPNNFRFEVWAYSQLSERELAINWNIWNRQRDRRCSLRDQTIRVVSNHGKPLR
jgi:hypothetical protein